jgi:site-specific DNA-methyltransferase (adenine-specific)
MTAPKLAYEDALVTLYHGDSLELSPVSADAIVTDPPYSRTGASTVSTTAVGKAREIIAADQFWMRWFGQAARQIAACVKPSGCGFIFTDYRTIHLIEQALADTGTGWLMSQALVWDRDSIGLGSPFRASHEMIAFCHGPAFRWTGPRNCGNVLVHRWPYGRHRHHPTEKPVELLGLLIELVTRPGDVVLDLFAGSGSTLVAAKLAGRRAIGCELVDAYCSIAARRLSNLREQRVA